MALSLNKPKLDNLATDIWKSAERLRGKFKSYEYQSVILPIIVIRRLECVLIDYEELLRRFSEQSGDDAGEHFTPREVVRLMVELLDIPIPEKHISIYDPASGTGGMLSVAKEHLLEREIAKPIIRWEETKKDGKTILGYEILPNKYFYRYQPPTPAKELLEEFWRLEKEAETMLKGLAK
jgi:type I restriction-modification system DNA methylase subunit